MALHMVCGPYAHKGSSQTQNQVARLNCIRHQAKSFAPLALHRIAQRSSPRQTLRNNQSEARTELLDGAAIVQIKTLASDYPSRRHHGRKFFGPMQALSGAKRGLVFRPRDDDGPWHDAPV
ncbi:MAG: hypothetical protein U1A72_17320 [Sulfuritalea sp.]|nr:hypothetical protein [Sulfuritalea sp.]